MNVIKSGRRLFFLTMLMAIMMTAGAIVSAAAGSDAITIQVNGKTVAADAAPYIKNDYTMVPASLIVKALNGTASWDEDAQSAAFQCGSTIVQVTIGSLSAAVNGQPTRLDVMPELKVVDEKGGARTMVPLRFVAESFGYQVDWVDATRTVKITTGSGSGTTTTAPTTTTTTTTTSTTPVATTTTPATTTTTTPAAAAAQMTVNSLLIQTGQTISGDTQNTYTNVSVTATAALNSGSASAGTWLTSPVRYYIDISNAKLGSGISNQTCSSDKSYVTAARAGRKENGVVRIVVDMKSKSTPKLSYSSDGKTLVLSFPENASGSSSTETATTTQTAPTTVDSTVANSLTDNKTTKHDAISEYAPYADGKIVVCIDPGHESATGGKRSPDGTLLEWEFNRDIAYRLKTLLEAQGYEVIMTVPQEFVSPTSKETYTLAKRVATANDAGNVDLFVSIHANANGNGNSWDSAHGWEVWVHKTGGVSEKAAKYIEEATKAQMTELTDRGIKKTSTGSIGLYVNRNTEMPSLLIEHAFFTNYNECQLMKTDAFRQRLAQANATGIINFFNSLK